MHSHVSFKLCHLPNRHATGPVHNGVSGLQNLHLTLFSTCGDHFCGTSVGDHKMSVPAASHCLQAGVLHAVSERILEMGL